MAEYIEREAVIARLKKLMQLQAPTARAIVEAIPAADVRPVVHSRWLWYPDKDWSGGGKTTCRACRFSYADGAYHEVFEFHFCPNCGADMRGGGSHE